MCTITDQNLNELSGLAAVGSGYVTINDGAAGFRNTLNLFFLDKNCKVTKTFTNSGPPRDPEDLAVGSDGTIWVADFGDNDKNRDTIALWEVPKGGNGQATTFSP